MKTINDINKIKEQLSESFIVINRTWEETRNDHITNRINPRLRAVRLIKKEINTVAGELISLCDEDIKNNKSLTFEEYRDVIVPDFAGNADEDTIYRKSIELLAYDLETVQEFEKRNVAKALQFVGGSIDICEKLPKDIEEGINYFCKILDGNTWMQYYNPGISYRSLYQKPEYNLCRRVCDYLEKFQRIDTQAQESLLILVGTVCLYTALKNEEYELCRDASIHNVPLLEEKSTQVQEVELPAELDTEEGRELLRKVIEAGFCNENYEWDESKWHEGEDVLALVCFVYMANKELGLIRTIKRTRKVFISWKPFDTLFMYRTKLKKESGKTQLQIAMTNYKHAKNLSEFVVPKKIERKLAPLFDKH